MTVIFAHRGSKSNRPENTLISFKEALRVGADGIELDVHRSNDNHLVVIHDETVDRTTNGIGLVRDLTLKQLKELDAGSWFAPEYFREKISTLEEVLDFLVDEGFRGTLNIEIKTDKYHYPGIEHDFARLLQSQKWPFDYLYCSFNFKSLKLMSELDPDVELAFLMKKNPFHIWLGKKTPFVAAIHPNKVWFLNDLTGVNHFSKAIRPWTLNKESQINLAFKYHLAGFMTDYPELAVKLKQLWQEKNQ
ncbi:glycerophosphodiester phosphodiesterase [Streptococcus hongkongensis]|nr:glycerophosphodiester phosphodiesterase [Streptococcus uberis]